MDNSPDTDARLTDLEIKASYTEDMLDTLNQTVFRQQQQIDALVHELRSLRERLPEAGSSAARGTRDELPPHY